MLANDIYVLPPRYAHEVGGEGLARKPVGTGPYRFVEWIRDDRVGLGANPNYWGSKPQATRVPPSRAPTIALGQLIHQIVHVSNLPHQRVPDLFDANAADDAGDLAGVGMERWRLAKKCLEVGLPLDLLRECLRAVARQPADDLVNLAPLAPLLLRLLENTTGPCARVRLTVCVTRKWAGAGSA